MSLLKSALKKFLYRHEPNVSNMKGSLIKSQNTVTPNAADLCFF